MISKTLMRDRVKMYGNNFPAFAKLVENLFDNTIEVTPQKAASILAALKKARMDYTKKKLDTATIGTDEYFALLKHYEDSVVDHDNYSWIADNYEKYLSL